MARLALELAPEPAVPARFLRTAPPASIPTRETPHEP